MQCNVLGLMSGTSLDGIDLVIARFIKRDKWYFKIIKAKTYSYSEDWKKTLENLHNLSKKDINIKDRKYGILLANKINEFITGEKIDLISSHGHTIFHEPKKKISLQIGDGKVIANKTQIKTINNFRVKDISLNGQGAPLVPIGDLLLFPEYKYCLNLGGFANISKKSKISITAFDICPSNFILNTIAKNLNLNYDVDGLLAKSGNIIPFVLEKLNSLNYYKIKGPKSLSREWVEQNIYPITNAKKYKTKDLLRTLSEHIAFQISKYLKDDKTLVTGGGTYNKFLIERIKHYSKSKIIIPNRDLVDFKEALIFGFLGLLRNLNEINCLKSVTGADMNSSCGIIHEVK